MSLAKINGSHRLLLDILCDAGISQYQFRQNTGISHHQLYRLLYNNSYTLQASRGRTAKDVEKVIIKKLIDYGIKPDFAVRWGDWVDPSQSYGTPRLHIILKENGISSYSVILQLPNLHKEFKEWLTRRRCVGQSPSLIVSISKMIIPWLRREHGLSDAQLEGWQERITPEQRLREIIQKEKLMKISRKERPRLGLSRDPFAWIPFNEDEFFNPPRLEALVDDAIDSAEQGLILAVIGSKGSGKSTLRIQFQQSVSEDIQLLHAKALVTKKYHAGEIIDDIMKKLIDKNTTNLSVNKKAQALIEELESKAHDNRWYCYILDEGDKLGEEELRAIKQVNEFSHKGRRMLSFLIFGQERLAAVLDSAKLKEVDLRTTTIVLPPLGDQLIEYCCHRLNHSSADGFQAAEILTQEAWQHFAVHAANSCFDQRIYYLDAHKLLSRVLKYAVMHLQFDQPQPGIIDAEIVDAAFNCSLSELEQRRYEVA